MNVNGMEIYASLLAEKQEDKTIIAAWLEEYTAGQTATKAAEPYDAPISPGQVRILSKQYASLSVAVLDNWDTGWLLVTPLSPYKTPATPGEMEAKGWGALQIWNSRTVPAAVLENSTVVGTLAEDIVSDALALFRCEMGGLNLPKTFKARRGAPIVLGSDPRRDYRDEEIKRATPLTDAALHWFDED